MGIQPKHIVHTETVPEQLARRALGIIWVTGIVCVLIIVLFFLYPDLTENRLSKQNKSQYSQFNSIDQLLLSSDEALLSDKKSFVNGALRFQWRNQEPDLNQGNNRSILYDNILKKKLQKIPKAQVADFSVRPVPQ